MRNRQTEEEERVRPTCKKEEGDSVEAGKWKRRIKGQGEEEELCKKKRWSHKRAKYMTKYEHDGNQ